MKLAFALAAHSVQSQELVEVYQDLELKTTQCLSVKCDLNRQGTCTVGYCRRVGKM
jgi:hypothetical protein